MTIKSLPVSAMNVPVVRSAPGDLQSQPEPVGTPQTSMGWGLSGGSRARPEGALQEGARGKDVIALQQALSRAGIAVEADGTFDASTRQAVASFQRKHALLDNGVAGSQTLALLNRPAPRGGPTPVGQGPRAVAEVSGPDKQGLMHVHVPTSDGAIDIAVRPINLGPDVKGAMARAVKVKNAEDLQKYGKTTAMLAQGARKDGYYGSPAHVAWANAASARTGGAIPATWWMEFDPYGGTAGNGPKILPSGKYPGLASKIAMCHDTDWSLGRYFNAGPLAPHLFGKADPDGKLGAVGLNPLQTKVPCYAAPRKDWVVTYP